jgi:hypothetical protein
LIGLVIGRPVPALLGIGIPWLLFIGWCVVDAWGNWGVAERGMLALYVALGISGIVAGGLGAMSRWLGKVK